MNKQSLDAATIQAYLESLPESDVAAIYDTIVRRVKRRWEFWVGVCLFLVWTAAWSVGAIVGGRALFAASVGGNIGGIVGAFVSVQVAARWLLPPYTRWMNNRILRDEVALRLAGNGV